MNKELNTEQFLSTRLSRRDLLKIAAVAGGIAMSQTACSGLSNLNKFIEKSRSCPEGQHLEVPSSYINDLEEIIAPLKRLMPPATAESLTIKVGKTNSPAGDGCSLDKNKEIRVLLPDTSQETLELGKSIAFHEASHTFNSSNKYHPSNYLKGEMKEKAGRRKYTLDEYKSLHEASYCDLDACKNYKWWFGSDYIYPDYDEMFASSLTILRFYPSEFMEKLEGVKDPESKRFLATNGRACIDALKKFSSIPVEDSDLPFDSKLISYLTQESQK